MKNAKNQTQSAKNTRTNPSAQNCTDTVRNKAESCTHGENSTQNNTQNCHH